MKKVVPFLKSAVAAFFTAVSGAAVAFADSNPLSSVPSVGVGGSGPGAGVYNYVMPQVGYIFLAGIAVMVVYYWLRHQHTKLIAALVTGSFVGVVAIEPKAVGPIISWFAVCSRVCKVM